MADKLQRYREKRDFALTPEPAPDAGTAPRPAGVLRFVVQKHDATRLHYDFRLEYDGVLRSWAVTRGPSADPGEKRLAVETEDHPLDYATFEGTIPKGEYGGGTVMVWDEGTWAMADGKDAAEGFDHGSLTFDLFGERMRGRWHLQRLRAEGKRPPQWLLIKSRDSAALDGGEDLTEAFTTSVATGRSLEAIAAAEDAVWHSDRGPGSAAEDPPTKTKAKGAKTKTRKAPDDGEAPEAPATAAPKRQKRSAVPAFVEPMLCKSREAPPKGDWLAEVKYDGYRAQLRAADGTVTILTRSAKDWTARFPDIAAAAAPLVRQNMLIDGEIVVFDDEGRTRFDTLQKAFASAGAISASFVAFDCLFDGGKDVRDEPIEARKARLAKRFGPEGVIRYGDHVAGKQAALYARAKELGLEGIVAKRAGSTYRSGRSEAWVKVRAVKHARFVIGAWTEQTDGKGLGALTVGAWHDGALVPCGRVGTGFSRAEAARLLADLETIAAPKSPFRGKVEGRGHHFVRPERVCDVAYLTMTDDGQVRHGVYGGIVDAPAAEVTLPSDHPLAQSDRTAAPKGRAKAAGDDAVPAKRAAADDDAAPKRRGRKAASATGAAEPISATPSDLGDAVVRSGKTVAVLGVTLSHPEKVLFDDQKVTKLALAEHYVRHAERMLPHVAGRPLTLVRCPQGTVGKCFFQRHPEGGMPERFARDVGEEDGAAIVVEEAADIVELAQKGVLEIHLRGARADRPDHPDRLVFDLDPGEGVDFAALKQAATDVRDALAAVDLESFVKTTGGKGLHVVVPIERRTPWETAKAWTRSFCERLADAEPDRFLIVMAKAKRKNRIFLDYLRNDRKASAVAPYSTRTRPGAPFSFPVTWAQLETLDVPAPLHVGDEAAGDPWAGMAAVKQRLTASHLKGVT